MSIRYFLLLCFISVSQKHKYTQQKQWQCWKGLDYKVKGQIWCWIEQNLEHSTQLFWWRLLFLREYIALVMLFHNTINKLCLFKVTFITKRFKFFVFLLVFFWYHSRGFLCGMNKENYRKEANILAAPCWTSMRCQAVCFVHCALFHPNSLQCKTSVASVVSV